MEKIEKKEIKSKYGVYYDIEDSDYFYEFEKHRFYFSSKNFMLKFVMELSNYIEEEKKKTDNKISNITNAIFFYKTVEKRGFRVTKINEYGKEENVLF